MIDNDNIEQPETNINPVVNQNLEQLLTFISQNQKNIYSIFVNDDIYDKLNKQIINNITANNYKHIEIRLKSNRSFLFKHVYNKLIHCEYNGELSYLEIKKISNFYCMKFCFL